MGCSILDCVSSNIVIANRVVDIEKSRIRDAAGCTDIAHTNQVTNLKFRPPGQFQASPPVPANDRNGRGVRKETVDIEKTNASTGCLCKVAELVATANSHV
eukprot:12758-Prorocentrum_minimum.AAC.3